MCVYVCVKWGITSVGCYARRPTNATHHITPPMHSGLVGGGGRRSASFISLGGSVGLNNSSSNNNKQQKKQQAAAKDLDKWMSYVGQEDVFHPTSTVKEVVLFHAHLR
jgi:hypothetical protein